MVLALMVFFTHLLSSAHFVLPHVAALVNDWENRNEKQQMSRSVFMSVRCTGSRCCEHLHHHVNMFSPYSSWFLALSLSDLFLNPASVTVSLTLLFLNIIKEPDLHPLSFHFLQACPRCSL